MGNVGATYGFPSGPRMTPFASLRGAAAALDCASARGSSVLGAILRVLLRDGGELVISKPSRAVGVCALG